MIITIRADIDDMSKIGAIIPQLDGSWSTRYPIFNGGYMIGSYRVPVNKKFILKSIVSHAEYKNIQMTNALAGFALGTVYLKLNGTIKMEYRVQWAGGTFNAITSDTSFGYNWRSLHTMKDLSFSVDDIITIEVSPIVSADLIPQVRWAGQMIWKKSTGQIDTYKYNVITTTDTANQIIASYTVPSGGCKLQHMGLEGISTDFMMGVVQIRLDGANILTMPLYSSAMMTRPVPVILQFYDGLTLGEGQEITVYGDFTHALNQTVQTLIFGSEISYGSGGSEVSYIF
jgi:hypothetical protein